MKPSVQSLVLRLFPALVASVGLLALAGWLLGRPAIANLGASGVPMAPSTAVLLVAFGVALFLRAPVHSPRGSIRTAVAISTAGAVVALLLLALSAQGMRLEAEHVGAAITHAANAPAVGHMSPVTAGCFLLVALSAVAAYSSGPGRPWLAGAARWLAGLLLAVSLFFAATHLLGTLFLYEGSFIPPAAPTSGAFILLALSLLFAHAPRDGREPGAPEADVQTSSLFIAIAAIAVAGVATGGRLYYQNYARHFRTAVASELSAVAALKVSELTTWRSERLGDANAFFDNVVFAALVHRWLDNPADKQAEATLRDWLASIRKSYSYDRVSLLDAQGVRRLSVPATSEPLESAVQQKARDVQRSGRVTFVDFYRDGPQRPIYLAVLAPILFDRDRPPIGSVVMRINPRNYLYPFISTWPVPSRTAETLLIRRDGNDALFLNALRFAPDAALALRVPLTKKEVPAVKAALGQEGIVDGIDYRGFPVVAAVRAIPDSPWMLVARMDLDEVYAPLSERLWVTIVVLATALASAVTVAALLQRRQQRARRLVVLEKEVAEARLLRLFFDLPFLGMARISPDTRHFLQFNDRLCEIVGYSRKELGSMQWTEITHPQDLEEETAAVARISQGDSDGFTLDQRFIRKDGVIVFASVDFKCVRRSDGAADYLVVMVEDITERKSAEEQLRQSQKLESVGLLAGGVAHEFNNMLAVILGNTELALRHVDPAQPLHADLLEVHKAAERSAELTQQLLAFARSQPVAPRVLDLNTTVPDMLTMLRRLIGEDIEVVWRPAAPLWPISMDPTQMDQILTNLVVNAQHAIAGIGTLTITTANRVIDEEYCATHTGVVPGEYVQLSVSDTGSGMDEATLARIFEPFFTTKDVGRGTGLGLSMVYGAVRQNHGFITVASAPGTGTTFEVHLPRHLGG